MRRIVVATFLFATAVGSAQAQGSGGRSTIGARQAARLSNPPAGNRYVPNTAILSNPVLGPAAWGKNPLTNPVNATAALNSNPVLRSLRPGPVGPVGPVCPPTPCGTGTWCGGNIGWGNGSWGGGGWGNNPWVGGSSWRSRSCGLLPEYCCWNPCWQDSCCGLSCNFWPYFPFFGGTTFVGGVSGGYGGNSYAYDPYFQQLQQQNQFLQQQLQQLAAQQAQPVKLKVAPNKPAARDKQLARQEQARRTVRHGTRLFTMGSYRRAADRFKEAARLDDQDATSLYCLAQALFASGKYAGAAGALRDALTRNPDWLELDFDMRQLYGDPGELTGQLATLAEELRQHPLDRDALFVLGFELFVTGEKEKARTILEQTARLERDDAHLKPFFDYFDALEP